jgi:hypothetical protein
MGMLIVSAIFKPFWRRLLSILSRGLPHFAPLPLDGRGFQPFFESARFSTSFAVKQRFCRSFAELPNCAQMARICAQMRGEQLCPSMQLLSLRHNKLVRVQHKKLI